MDAIRFLLPKVNDTPLPPEGRERDASRRPRAATCFRRRPSRTHHHLFRPTAAPAYTAALSKNMASTVPPPGWIENGAHGINFLYAIYLDASDAGLRIAVERNVVRFPREGSAVIL
jgi:hypothetical protein